MRKMAISRISGGPQSRRYRYLAQAARDRRLATAKTERLKNKNTENFPVGSFLIRPDLRVHIHALYDFARAADDISDDPILEPTEKIRRLDHFAVTLTDDNRHDQPEAARLRSSLQQTGVSPQHALDLLTAFKRDATKLRYTDWDDLLDYCRYSASPVGRHVLALHGIGEASWSANDALCSVLQIINHIQDCADDYRELDRVYIPQDMMAYCGAQTANLAEEYSMRGMESVKIAMLDLMEPMMIEACKLPSLVPDMRLKCETSVIVVLAERLIEALRRRDPLAEDVRLGKWAMAWAALTGLMRAWR